MRLVVFHAYPALIVLGIAGNALLAVWALAADLRRRAALGPVFWSVTLAVVAVVALQIASGIVLALGGSRPRVPLHFLYGILVTAAAVLQFGLRPGGSLRPIFMRDAQRREPRALALLCLTQAALLARAYTTGAFGR